MKRGYSHILAVRVCAAGEGIAFKPFGLVKGMVFKPFAVVKGMVFKPFGLVKGRTFANPAAHPTQTIWEYPPGYEAVITFLCVFTRHFLDLSCIKNYWQILQANVCFGTVNFKFTSRSFYINDNFLFHTSIPRGPTHIL